MELSKENYSELLSRYNKLRDCNKEKKQLGIHDYSLMNALLKKTDEVNLHSNFIYSMIDPRSSHYCGNIFLKLFLDSIGKSNFINTDNARVYKEKGKIDLLIEDGERVIIIENKLRAVDQMHQISRYVQHVKEKYFVDINDVSDKICIVYLSEYKNTPSEDKESMIGFSLKDHKLIWKNVDKEIHLCNNTILALPEKTKFSFIRVRHSNHLSMWTEESIDWLKKNRKGSGLINAFREYKLILDRLKNNNWRKIMRLDEYTLGLDKEEQEKMYQFMKESARYLNYYKGKKLFSEVSSLFDTKKPAWSNIDNKKIKEFTDVHCENWFRQKGNKDKWKNVGFKFEKDSKEFIFILAEYWIYLGECKNDEYFMKENRIIIDSSNEKKATKKFDIHLIIDKINEKLKQTLPS